MREDKTLNSWADCHVFYNLYDHPSNSGNDLLQGEKTYWRRYIRDNTPNGHLILQNSMFDLLQNNKIHLLHVTTEKKLRDLSKEKSIFPSGGCLVGSIYCSPLFQDERENYRLHNLGEYILTEEAPRAMQNDGDDDDAPVPIVIEATLPKRAQNNLVGIDYLRLGEIHLTIYKELEYLLSPAERFELEEEVLLRVRNSIDFLSMCSRMLYHGTEVNHHEFMAMYKRTVTNLPILGYFLFEVISEYLLLHQNCAKTQEYKDRGEFYNWHYKQMAFALYPNLLKKFNLSGFKPDVMDVISYFSGTGILKLEEEHFGNYLMKRLAFLVNARLLRSASSEIDWRRLEWRFFPATQVFGALLGHLIHRHLRSFERYPWFYYYYDQYKALQVWNYWNHNDIAVPFNGVIPKGEIGINPAYSEADFKFFRGKKVEGKPFVKKERQLPLKAVPKLVELKYTFMRNK